MDSIFTDLIIDCHSQRIIHILNLVVELFFIILNFFFTNFFLLFYNCCDLIFIKNNSCNYSLGLKMKKALSALIYSKL